jgi:hypothetical protein
MIVTNNSRNAIPLPPNGKLLAPSAQAEISDADASDRFVAAWIKAGLLQVIPQRVETAAEATAETTETPAKNWRDRLYSE